DRGGRLRRRGALARVRIPLQAGRRATPSRVRGAASAPARLADVVRGAESVRGHAAVSAVPGAVAARISAGAGSAADQSLRRPSTEIRPGAALPLSLHDAGGATDDRGVVEERPAG